MSRFRPEATYFQINFFFSLKVFNMFHRLITSFSKRLLSSISIPGDGMEFVKSALHKDNIKIATLIGGGLIVGGGLVVEGSFVLYKVIENAKELKELEIRIFKEMKENANENAKETKELAKEMRELERVIVSQFSNLQTAMISVLASPSTRRPDEIVDALRREKQSDVTSNSKRDDH